MTKINFKDNGDLERVEVDIDLTAKTAFDVKAFVAKLDELKKAVKDACIKVSTIDKYSYAVGLDVGRFVAKLEDGRSFTHTFGSTPAINYGRSIAMNEYLRACEWDSKNSLTLVVAEGPCRPIPTLVVPQT